MNTTDLTPIPARPNLEQYRKQAKELVKAFRKKEDISELKRIRKFHPRFRRGTRQDLEGQRFVLADAQLTIARDHGFETWPKFLKHLQDITDKNSLVLRFEKAADAIVDGDVRTLKRLLREDPSLIGARSPRVHNAMLVHYIGA